MHVITSRADSPRLSYGTIALGTLVGAILFFGGLVVAWLTFATPFLTRFTPGPRPGTTEMVAGALAWTFALIAPSTFVIVGLARIASVVEAVGASRPRRPVAARAARSLGDDIVVGARLRLPDGRLVPEVILGPFGAAVIEELPPSGATRQRDGAWEVRMEDGHWSPLENPLDRAARDAERVRRFLSQDDQDFIVKVYAAVLAPDTTLPRTPTCAVITRKQIPAWLAALPVQRSLTEARRARLTELLRELS